MKLALKSLLGVLFVGQVASIEEVVIVEDGDFKITSSQLAGPTKPRSGDNIAVHYAGKFTDGNQFDSSYSRNRPFTFEIGKGNVIKCWEEAFMYLSKGMKAQIFCPSDYAYGSSGAGRIIPANADLIFDVELIDINPTEKS